MRLPGNIHIPNKAKNHFDRVFLKYIWAKAVMVYVAGLELSLKLEYETLTKTVQVLPSELIKI